MASTLFRFFLLLFLLALNSLCIANARAPLEFDHPKPATITTISSFMARLKLDKESPNCWESLIHLQSCTGELILFFLNGETDLGHSCCQAIRTISHQCWPNMIDTLGFTTEESHVLEGYCDHEDDSSSTTVDNSSKFLYP